MSITALLLVSLLHGPAAARDTGFTPTVVLVRHAEKASATDPDSPLSDIGRARALALDSTLMDAQVTAVIVTQYKRTQETAAPVAARHHLTPIIVPVSANNVAAHLAEVARVVSEHGGVVLVVGHSNTVTRIVHALGGPVLPDLCDGNYASIFTVATATAGAIVRSRFGAAEPVGAERCAGMTPR